jgi:DNA polymerase-3 subunit gamma/tau
LSLLDQAIAYAAAGDGRVDGAIVSEMLGLADRTLLFDLLDAIMAGRAADALGLLDHAYESGAEPGQVLTDLLELLHVLTRIKSIPELASGTELPELERTRGADAAARLGVAWFARAWQMLLKGVAELDLGPSRIASAEMTIIRLCFVSDLPTPAELVQRLSSPGSGGGGAGGGGGAQAGAPRAIGGGGGGAAVARSMPERAQAPEPVQGRPQPTSWREVVTLVAASGREPMLHGHLRYAVRPVRVAPGLIELRQLDGTPRDLAARLAKLLREETGVRWTVALSNADGDPTLGDQGRAVRDSALADMAAHPLVREILRVFPGARIGEVTDTGLDDYGLPAEAPLVADFVLGGEADGPPPDPDEIFSDAWEIER